MYDMHVYFWDEPGGVAYRSIIGGRVKDCIIPVVRGRHAEAKFKLVSCLQTLAKRTNRTLILHRGRNEEWP